jgi:hypothetical protein
MVKITIGPLTDAFRARLSASRAMARVIPLRRKAAKVARRKAKKITVGESPAFRRVIEEINERIRRENEEAEQAVDVALGRTIVPKKDPTNENRR